MRKRACASEEARVCMPPPSSPCTMRVQTGLQKVPEDTQQQTRSKSAASHAQGSACSCSTVCACPRKPQWTPWRTQDAHADLAGT